MPGPFLPEEESVTCQGVIYKLRPGVFYHLVDPEGFLLWNARLSEGLVDSASLIASAEGLEDVTTLYHFARAQDPKERVWEKSGRYNSHVGLQDSTPFSCSMSQM